MSRMWIAYKVEVALEWSALAALAARASGYGRRSLRVKAADL